MDISSETFRLDADSRWIDLGDGRVIGVPLAWFPRPLQALRENGMPSSPSGEERIGPMSQLDFFLP